MARCPNLKIIGNFGVGYDSVDVAAAAKRGIVITNTPDVLTEEVADTTLGLLLVHGARVLPGREMAARRPLGQGGRLSAHRRLAARPLGRHRRLRPHRQGHRPAHRGFRPAGQLLWPQPAAGRHQPLLQRPRRHGARRRHADRWSLPGGPATQNLINAAVLDALGPRGILINMARGSVVDEAALIAALKGRKILRRRPRRLRRRAEHQSGVPGARQRHPVSARGLGLEPHAQRHGPAGGRQPRRLRRRPAAEDAGAGDALQGLAEVGTWRVFAQAGHALQIEPEVGGRLAGEVLEVGGEPGRRPRRGRRRAGG